MSDNKKNTPADTQAIKKNVSPTSLIIETAEITQENTTALTEATDKYSDYDIAVEEQEFYGDALYSSDDELDQAITQGFEKIEDEDPIASTQRAEQDENQAQIHQNPVALNLLDHLSEHSRQAKFKAGLHLFSKDGTHLPYSKLLSDKHETLLTGSHHQAEVFTSKLPMAIRAEQVKDLKPAKALLSAVKINCRYQFDKIAISLREYLGSSLPERIIDLDYKPLKLKSQKDIGNIVSRHDIETLFQSKGVKAELLLSKSAHELSKIIKCSLSVSRKADLIVSFKQQLAPHFKALVSNYLKRPTSEKNSHYSDIAESLRLIFKNITMLYKQLYMPLYQGSNLYYGPQRAKANQLAIELLDWLCLEQSILNATRSPLPTNSVKTFNSLFYALSQYEPELIDKEFESSTYSSTSNLRTLYIRYQLLQLIDFSRINSKTQAKLSNIISKHSNNVNLFTATEGQFSDCQFVAFDSAEPMQSLGENETNTSKGTGIDLSIFSQKISLKRKLLSDSLGSSKADQHNVSDFNAYCILVEQLTYSATHRKANQLPSTYQPINLTVYPGFNHCFNYSMYSYADNAKQTQKEATEIELPDAPKACQCQWLVATNNKHEISLQTQELKLQANLNIGAPVLFRDNDDANSGAIFVMGAVQRISRTQAGLINIDVLKLSPLFTGVILKSGKSVV